VRPALATLPRLIALPSAQSSGAIQDLHLIAGVERLAASTAPTLNLKVQQVQSSHVPKGLVAGTVRSVAVLLGLFEHVLADVVIDDLYGPHDLRHTHATLLLKAGVPVKVVSERLGHASVTVTLEIYQHVMPGMQAEAAAMFAAIVGGP
jgi:hypothetical protein